jgi:putative protease
VAAPVLRRPELVAPAGKRETFFAALNAGADAVYLGLHKFNARLKSENFTLEELARLVPYAQERGKKVFVALNTLCKQFELPEAVALLPALEKIGVDALVVADLGLAVAARARVPGLRLHASTQAGIHSSRGALKAGELGFRRVILARELTGEELALIRARTPLELEIFVHGALCYSFSGFCLASSFIGGKSGNRGLCTQVCRRDFAAGKNESAFFSPRDLALLERVPELTRLGIDAFKIEGRLKGASYVTRVVSTYRQAIDRPEDIPALIHEIEADFGRAKTTYFFDGPDRATAAALIQPDSESGAVGVRLGEVIAAVGGRVTVRTALFPVAGDSVRIQPATGFEGRRYKVASVLIHDNVAELSFHTEATASSGDLVFLVDRGSAAPAAPPELPAPRRFPMPDLDKARALLESLIPPAAGTRTASFFSLKFGSPDWLPEAEAALSEAARVIVILDLTTGPRFAASFPRLAPAIQRKIVVGFPLFLPETEVEEYDRLARDLAGLGVRRFWAESLGGLAIPAPPGNARFTAAPSLGALNAVSRVALQALGADFACYPLEDDFLNMRNSRCAPAALVVWGHVPLFIARLAPGLAEGATLRDRNGNEFFAARRFGLSWLLGKEPVCLFAKRDKLEELGVREFILDLSFTPPDSRFLNDLLAAYKERRRPLPSTLFNFKRELA